MAKPIRVETKEIQLHDKGGKLVPIAVRTDKTQGKSWWTGVYPIQNYKHIQVLDDFYLKEPVFKKLLFRNLEEEITIKQLNTSNNVISLGGGSFINEKIRNEVITNNISFWLNWDTTTLLNRIKKSKKRKVAYNLNNNKLIELITKRSKIYSKEKFNRSI